MKKIFAILLAFFLTASAQEVNNSYDEKKTVENVGFAVSPSRHLHAYLPIELGFHQIDGTHQVAAGDPLVCDVYSIRRNVVDLGTDEHGVTVGTILKCGDKRENVLVLDHIYFTPTQK